MNNEEISLNQLLLEKNMMVGALEGLATFVSDYLSKPEVDIKNLEALMGMIYGIQLMAETHSTNLDSYEVKLIDEKCNR